MDHGGDEPVREIIKQLRGPITDLDTLISLITAPLDCLGLLPPQFRHQNSNPLPRGAIVIRRHIPSIQRALLDHIYPTWEPLLHEHDYITLVQQYFCPDAFHFALNTSGSIALQAFSTILSTRLSSQCIGLLEDLTKNYPIDRLHLAIFQSGSRDVGVEITWEDCVQNVVSVPAKVANFAAATGKVPSILQQGAYFDHIATRMESLIGTLSSSAKHNSTVMESLSYLLTKLVTLGIFPFSPPDLPSQSSFFRATLPAIRHRVLAEEDARYSAFWAEVIFGIPSTLSVQTIIASLFRSLKEPDVFSDDRSSTRASVKREALFLGGILGQPAAYTPEQFDVVFSVILGREFDEARARIFICWLSSNGMDDALERFLDEVIAIWSSSEHIKHSLLSRHRYVSALLLLCVSYFATGSAFVASLATDGRFIEGVGSYIGHMDPSVRLCGMLAAEVVASSSSRKLEFEVWDGDGPGKAWARALRKLILHRDVDAELSPASEAENVPAEAAPPSLDDSAPLAPTSIVLNDAAYDSDDSVTGYDSPSSSRAASPTPSELEEMEKDPSLNVTTKKVQRPVYLVQLGELLRGSNAFNESGAAHEADKVDMALAHGEDLIRRKRDFGTELDENAVNLVHAYLNLSDKYDLTDFDKRCQGALVALVACSPRKAAPSLVEEFFKNQYSIEQRRMVLNALVLGAQELSDDTRGPAFPSKVLPPALRAKYELPAISEGPVSGLLANVLESVHQPDKKAPVRSEPPRERRLRVRKAPLVTENVSQNSTPGGLSFTQVAAEHFIGPLLNRFWLFLRDEQTREDRTSHLKGRQQYYGAGTGLILNPSILRSFLNALSVLIHLARHAPEWSAVIAPDALELAVTVGTRPVSRLEEEEASEEKGADGANAANKQASMLTAVLEMILIILDSALDLDDGRSLSLEHGALIMGISEWATTLFSHLDGGIKVQGSGGSAETALPRVCAGVVVKVDHIISKWRRSMVDVA